MRIFANVIVFIVLSWFLAGCGSLETAVEANGGIKQSETEFGGGITGLAGKQLSNELTSIYKNAEWSNPISNGFFVGPLVGYKLPVSVLDMSVFTGIDYMRLDDFKADNRVIEEGHNSMQFKLGVS